MKTFEPTSIYNRLVDKLSQNPDWKAVIGDSVISSILKATAEVNAETARYAEHLYKESRWDTAQNTSSIVAAAGQLGYKPARKKSTFGEIYISEDPRIHLVGRSIVRDAFLSLNGTTPRISNWKKPTSDILFDRNVSIVDSKGNNYIMTSINSLDTSTANAFELSSGSAYVRNTIIQGTVKELEIPLSVAQEIATRSKLDPYVFLPVEIPNCENADTSLTRSFFRVFVQMESGYREEYRVVDTLHLSESEDSDVEVYGDLYNRDVIYLKFNASSTRGKTLSLSTGSGIDSIVISYIETLGASGNLTHSYEQFSLTNLPGASSGKKLYGISLDPFLTGSDEESIYDIKQNAPTYYMNTYSVATKESYENILKKIDFNGESATKVRVFAKTIDGEVTGTTQRITEATMILPSLEDLATSTEDNPYESIEKTINYYLAELKAPTDVIKFTPPTYLGFGIGVSCSADRSLVDNLTTLKSDMRQTLDDIYGARSTQLDFAKPVYTASIISTLKNEYPALRSVKVELEAVTKLNWNNTQRIKPVEGANHPIRTLRVPFSFNSLFEGSEDSGRGFKDYRTGASYTIRLDIFYKASSYSSVSPYHTSIFVKENPDREHSSFFYIKDTAENTPIWPYGPDNEGAGVVSTAGYPFENENYSQLEDGYQFYFKKKYYTDAEFEDLIDNNSLTTDSLLTSSSQTPGALDSFALWWGDSVDSTEDDAGDGFFEFDIDSIYSTLVAIANQDSSLRTALGEFDYTTLRCGASDSDVLELFVKDLLANYVDIYVSRRLVEEDLTFTDSEKNNDVVLYVDTQDQLGADDVVSEGAQSRRSRLLSVECELV